MAGALHAAHCPNCNGDKFREERIVTLDSGVVIRKDMPVEARAIQTEYRYICIQCNQILDQPWEKRHQ
jgi:hypothetical protein